MTRYAIKVVPSEWNDRLPLPFHQTTHDYNKIEPGMHVLVYRRGDGIIGEGEVGDFVHAREWTDLPAALAQADYLLPLEQFSPRAEAMSPDAVRDQLDDRSFPQGDTWRPIDRDLYDLLTGEV